MLVIARVVYLCYIFYQLLHARYKFQMFSNIFLIQKQMHLVIKSNELSHTKLSADRIVRNIAINNPHFEWVLIPILCPATFVDFMRFVW